MDFLLKIGRLILKFFILKKLSNRGVAGGKRPLPDILHFSGERKNTCLLSNSQLPVVSFFSNSTAEKIFQEC